MTRISEIGTNLAVTSNSRKRYISLKRRFLQEPHGVPFQKTASFEWKTSSFCRIYRKTCDRLSDDVPVFHAVTWAELKGKLNLGGGALAMVHVILFNFLLPISTYEEIDKCMNVRNVE
jgi:hypothetical protein